MPVTLNGRTYDITDFTASGGYGYAQNGVTGVALFPNQIFTDMLAEIASANTVYGVSPGAVGGYLRSNGSAWIRANSIYLPAVPSAEWSIDGAARGTQAIATASWYDLAAGSGELLLADNATGEIGLYLLGGGAVVKVSGVGGTSMVVGASPTSTQTAVYYEAAVPSYRIHHGFAATRNYFMTTIKVRTSV